MREGSFFFSTVSIPLFLWDIVKLKVNIWVSSYALMKNFSECPLHRICIMTGKQVVTGEL